MRLSSEWSGAYVSDSRPCEAKTMDWRVGVTFLIAGSSRAVLGNEVVPPNTKGAPLSIAWNSMHSMPGCLL